MHIWLRNGFVPFLILGLWLKPPCRLSVAVLNELAFAAAYMAVGIALLGVCAHVRRRYGHQSHVFRASLESQESAVHVSRAGCRCCSLIAES
jgi:hypothetical protein